MNTYETAYAALNTNQKDAVDTIEGPVMVIAGPGTGKTQLLSMRVANILKQTDSLPNNILCLTFTESGATAMRQRLLKLMGPAAHKVAIHTFHSFGAEIINQNPDYFYHGAHFRAADELSSYEVLQSIFQELPHDNPLASTMNGEFTALRDTQATIGELKKAGLTPKELLSLLDHNEAFIDFAEPYLAETFDVPRLSKKEVGRVETLLAKLQSFQAQKMPLSLFSPLHQVCQKELEIALDQAKESGKTTSLTAWRNRWLERNHARHYVCKDRRRMLKLRAIAAIYDQYLTKMQERALFDFDDMILRVLHALETFPELRYSLQEQFLYIHVDEFQDTNGAQLRLLHNLTNNEVSAGRPNIMVVGDDDQAIYAFQGAEISNILRFPQLYTNPHIVTLTDNYRSSETILKDARTIITQGEYRLETSMQGVNKTPIPHVAKNHDTASELHTFSTPANQYAWVIQQIKTLQEKNIPLNTIAILGRNHKHLIAILPYLHEAQIDVEYERRNNILEMPPIAALVTLARVINALSLQEFDVAEAFLPELLSYEFWGLSTHEIWDLSISTYKERIFWLEGMLKKEGKLHDIAEFLITTSHYALHESLESILDILVGSHEDQAEDVDSEESEANMIVHEQFISPFRDYYFTAQQLSTNPPSYLSLLSSLRTLRQALREYRPDQRLFLEDFVEFIDLHEKVGIPITDTSAQRDGKEAIHLMTAHKSKGLEFNAVFILDCQEKVWGTGARSRQNSVSLPSNLPIAPAGTTNDDCLRLFFVAMTRAKYYLYLSSYETDANNKQDFIASFLEAETCKIARVSHKEKEMETPIAQLTPSWHSRHSTVDHTDMHTFLQPRLENYQLSATHLNNFIDLTSGGPQAWLLQNFLRFPQSTPPYAAFGSAIHTALQHAHAHLALTGNRKPIEDVLHDFEQALQRARLSEHDFFRLNERGATVLNHYLSQRYEAFNTEERAEVSFARQNVVVGEARLTGAIDLLHIDRQNKTIVVTDYKTSKAPRSWQGKTDSEKIKLHKYRQQLMMYVLLLQGSRDFSGYTINACQLEFVVADEDNAIRQLEFLPTASELQDFSLLIQAIWDRIMTLDLPDIRDYPTNYNGILAFEDDLRKN